jgi:hypothetical protein
MVNNNSLEYGFKVSLAGFGEVLAGVNYQNQPVGINARLQNAADHYAELSINSDLKAQYNWADSGAVIGYCLLDAGLMKVGTMAEAVYQIVYVKRPGDGLRSFSRVKPTRKVRSDKRA